MSPSGLWINQAKPESSCSTRRRHCYFLSRSATASFLPPSDSQFRSIFVARGRLRSAEIKNTVSFFVQEEAGVEDKQLTWSIFDPKLVSRRELTGDIGRCTPFRVVCVQWFPHSRLSMNNKEVTGDIVVCRPGGEVWWSGAVSRSGESACDADEFAVTARRGAVGWRQ